MIRIVIIFEGMTLAGRKFGIVRICLFIVLSVYMKWSKFIEKMAFKHLTITSIGMPIPIGLNC